MVYSKVVPEALPISATGACLPVAEGDGALVGLLAVAPLHLPRVPPEEGPAGVARHPTIVKTTFCHWLATHQTLDDTQLCHALQGMKSLIIFTMHRTKYLEGYKDVRMRFYSVKFLVVEYGLLILYTQFSL